MASWNVIFAVLLAVNIALCRASPRDSTVRAQTPIVQDNESQHVLAKEKATTLIAEQPAVPIPGRISCPHDEATEDEVCLDHCVPKGYSYGICVSRTCSCI